MEIIRNKISKTWICCFNIGFCIFLNGFLNSCMEKRQDLDLVETSYRYYETGEIKAKLIYKNKEKYKLINFKQNGVIKGECLYNVRKDIDSVIHFNSKGLPTYSMIIFQDTVLKNTWWLKESGEIDYCRFNTIIKPEIDTCIVGKEYEFNISFFPVYTKSKKAILLFDSVTVPDTLCSSYYSKLKSLNHKELSSKDSESFNFKYVAKREGGDTLRVIVFENKFHYEFPDSLCGSNRFCVDSLIPFEHKIIFYAQKE